MLIHYQNVTPLPQNLSPTQTHASPKPVVEGSQDSMRMSSFVDFDAAGIEEEDMKPILPQPALPPAGAERKAMIDEVSLGSVIQERIPC
jgi:hypothetical protein